MKKFISTLLIVTSLSNMALVLTGCGEKDNLNDKQNEVESNNTEETGKLDIESTDDSIILTDETGTQMIITFDSEDKVVGLSLIAEFETEEEANLMKEMYADDTTAEVKLDGKKVTLEYNETYIKTLFAEETRATIEASLAEEK